MSRKLGLTLFFGVVALGFAAYGLMSTSRAGVLDEGQYLAKENGLAKRNDLDKKSDLDKRGDLDKSDGRLVKNEKLGGGLLY